MIEEMRLVAAEAGGLAGDVPAGVLDSLARSLTTTTAKSWPAVKAELTPHISHAPYRGRVAEFLDRINTRAGKVSPPMVSMALLTAISSRETHGNASMDLVWTGPDGDAAPVRRTEQALLQVINAATSRLTIVSYAVFHIPNVKEALIKAADRGVDITIVVESPDRNEGQKAYSTLAALGKTVAQKCSVYVWPIERRKKNESGKAGLLHVKCAASDGRMLFLSSANLTVQAFTLNMELGVLVTGGTLPVQVEGQFERLIEKGMLVRA